MRAFERKKKLKLGNSDVTLDFRETKLDGDPVLGVITPDGQVAAVTASHSLDRYSTVANFVWRHGFIRYSHFGFQCGTDRR